MAEANLKGDIVVWLLCYLWFVSLTFIMWSLFLFFSASEILTQTGLDLVCALMLLSGLIMLPTNIHMLNFVSKGRPIDHKSKVLCCPLWLALAWVIVTNLAAAILCLYRIYCNSHTTTHAIVKSIRYYRNSPDHKRFIDNVQWSLKCCGLDSYKDWFHHDWNNKLHDYRWDHAGAPRTQKDTLINDSVPLSCCKSGSCVADYLTELGTNFINKKGCGSILYKFIAVSVLAQLLIFVSVVLIEVFLLYRMIKSNDQPVSKDIMITPVMSFRNIHAQKNFGYDVKNVAQIMTVNEKFNASSGSYEYTSDESDSESERPICENDNAKLTLSKTETKHPEQYDVNDE